MELVCWDIRWLLCRMSRNFRACGYPLIIQLLLQKLRDVTQRFLLVTVFLRFLIPDKVNVHWRSPESATDTATSMEAVQEFLKNHLLVTNLALIQCTSPFIKTKYLQKAIKRIKFYDCVFSVVTSFKLRWQKQKFTKRIIPLNFDIKNRPRRQDWRGELLETGMFYFSKRSLLDQRLFQNEKWVQVY